MHHRAVIMSIVLFVLIVGGMFFFAYLREIENERPQQRAIEIQVVTTPSL